MLGQGFGPIQRLGREGGFETMVARADSSPETIGGRSETMLARRGVATKRSWPGGGPRFIGFDPLAEFLLYRQTKQLLLFLSFLFSSKSRLAELACLALHNNYKYETHSKTLAACLHFDLLQTLK